MPAKNLSCVFDRFCMFLQGVLKDDGFEILPFGDLIYNSYGPMEHL